MFLSLKNADEEGKKELSVRSISCSGAFGQIHVEL